MKLISIGRGSTTVHFSQDDASRNRYVEGLPFSGNTDQSIAPLFDPTGKSLLLISHYHHCGKFNFSAEKSFFCTCIRTHDKPTLLPAIS
jgi:hypothetical protein